MAEGSEKTFRRRDVLKAGVAAGVGLGTAPLVAAAAEKKPEVRAYRTLGRTGMKVSDISYGSGATTNALLPIFAYERGINYFDTAETYPLTAHGVAEKKLGRGLLSQVPRDKVYIASKTEAQADDDRGTLMRRLERSLERLRTDYVDVYMNHAVNDVARLKNPEWHEFIGRAKQQGKVRFTGMSGHGGNLIECLDYGLDNELFDVILVAHNFGQDPAFYARFLKDSDMIAINPELPSRIERASKQGVGVIAMKTRMGGKLNDLSAYEAQGSTTNQAAFRWVLSGQHVDAMIVTFARPQQVNEFLGASGETRLRSGDAALLRAHLVGAGQDYCRHGCSDCDSSCPQGVAISEVLRTRMYASHYGDRAMAEASYARIGNDATACLSCSVQSCAGACPYGLDIPKLTRATPGIVGAG